MIIRKGILQQQQLQADTLEKKPQGYTNKVVDPDEIDEQYLSRDDDSNLSLSPKNLRSPLYNQPSLKLGQSWKNLLQGKFHDIPVELTRFRLRGDNYLNDKVKIPAKSPAFQCVHLQPIGFRGKGKGKD